MVLLFMEELSFWTGLQHLYPSSTALAIFKREADLLTSGCTIESYSQTAT